MSERAAGILLHATSLPGPPGIGDLGPAARRFVDWLAAAGQRVWQLLPAGPTGFGNSPYGALSAFAGNPLLIAPEELRRRGWLPAGELAALPPAAGRVDYPAVAAAKQRLLRLAWEGFQRRAAAEERRALAAFVDGAGQRFWLEDWALFAALRERHDRTAWGTWPAPLRRREPAALVAARAELAAELDFQRFVQFLFFEQWERLRAYANARGVELLGDLPLYAPADSADVWAHQTLFRVGRRGRPRRQSGVPPDAFSADGQLWGHPLYDWRRMAADGYRWWIERLRAGLRLADRLRLDHFRGFAGYWEVPADAETAAAGRWRRGPGRRLFEAARRELGELPLIAEDLGVITPDVVALRRRLELPGMRVLQFAFDAPGSDHLPHAHERDTVVYTGTHDNDTAVGWFGSLAPPARRRVLDYLGGDGTAIHHDLIRAAYTSVAELAIVPLQDVLGLDGAHRLNRPGQVAGCWEWRAESAPGDDTAGWLRRLAEVSGRTAPRAAPRKTAEEVAGEGAGVGDA